VHGQGDRHGFIPQLIATAWAKGVCGYIGDGTSRWPAVHVKDAARLYRLAAEQAPASSTIISSDLCDVGRAIFHNGLWFVGCAAFPAQACSVEKVWFLARDVFEQRLKLHPAGLVHT
jgi:hypothetical protein